jgi:hypothetical protein
MMDGKPFGAGLDPRGEDGAGLADDFFSGSGSALHMILERNRKYSKRALQTQHHSILVLRKIVIFGKHSGPHNVPPPTEGGARESCSDG